MHFFFKQKTAYEMRISDWSSDVCSSDLMGVGGPDLRAVEDIIPAIAVGAKLERGEIRPRARFRKALAPIILARQDARQIMRALFRRPVMHDDRRDHFQPHWGAGGELGRASCRERVCQNVEISVVAVSVKKKK